MRVRTGLLLVLGLIILSGLGFWLIRSRSPAPPATIAVAPPPAPAPEAPPPEPTPAPPPTDATAPDATPAAPPAQDNAAQPAAAPAEQGLPPLQEVKVTDRPIHTVPEDKTPDPRSSQPTAGQSEEVRLGAHALAPPPLPHQFSGAATPTGAVELKVDATIVSLFGIKAPIDRDRCADAGGDCAAVAKRALADRIGNGGKISCRIPNPRPGSVAYAICLDPTGFDLSGFLIAQGLALADTAQSYDYVGAESIARNLKRGLWKFRS